MNHPVEQRLVEVIGIALQRRLTQNEARDLKESYQYIVNRGWKLGRIINLLKLARDTRDWDWYWALTAEYDKLI